ncbi:UTP--glucose-1-phosphate uridylyltransferase GalU [Herbaspirillum sp. HC18]|nr:UTP--glucose-1-phosphate uridylyltransferase GalU [Herbaspirillum sp. HC18]
MNKVTKAVFPVAGLGTRFLPATKAQPKEMLPVVDKPLIQYAVEEAVAAGITELIFVTGRNKRAIEDHFDTAHELELELEAGGKTKLLEALQNTVPRNVHCIYIRQPAPLGLGHAVLCARPVVGVEPFAVLLADDLMDVSEGQKPVLAQMAETYRSEGASLLAVQDVAREETRQYGIVSTKPYKERLELVEGIVEKPSPEDAPSTLGVVGRYVLNNRVFDCLEGIGKGAGGEIQLTDGIAELMKHERVMAFRFAGRRYDCGSKLGYLQATVEMGLKHPDMGPAFARYLEQLK